MVSIVTMHFTVGFCVTFSSSSSPANFLSSSLSHYIYIKKKTAIYALTKDYNAITYFILFLSPFEMALSTIYEKIMKLHRHFSLVAGANMEDWYTPL